MLRDCFIWLQASNTSLCYRNHTWHGRLLAHLVCFQQSFLFHVRKHHLLSPELVSVWLEPLEAPRVRQIRLQENSHGVESRHINDSMSWVHPWQSQLLRKVYHVYEIQKLQSMKQSYKMSRNTPCLLVTNKCVLVTDRLSYLVQSDTGIADQ